MKKQNFLMRKVAGYAASAMALVLLAACSAPLSKVDEYGKTDAPVFPDLSKASMDLREGVVLDKGVVALLRPGLSRDQLYQLLGRPHFAEGFRVREWDYVLYLGERGKDQPCQLKVLFDKNLRAQSYHWLPAGCQGAPVKAAASQPIRLSADALFDFNSSTLRAGAETELNDLAIRMGGRLGCDTFCVVVDASRKGAKARRRHVNHEGHEEHEGRLGICKMQIKYADCKR